MKRSVCVLTTLLFCFGFLPNSLLAEEALTWKDAVLEAKKHHPDLVPAREKWNQSKADKAITASAFFPKLNGDATLDRSKASSSTSNAYSYGVSAKQLLFDGFKTYFDVEQAAKKIASSEYNYRVTSSNVRLNLRIAFVDLLKAQELLHLTEEIAKRRQQSRDLIQLRYEACREHKGSLMTAEANLAQADFEVEQAKRNIVLSERRFVTQLGRSRLTPLRAVGDLTIASFDRAKPDLEILAETTPLLQQLIVLEEAAKWGVKSSQASFFPQIYANASTEKSDSDWPPDKTGWSLGASFSLPLFEGGSRVAGVSKTKAALRQAEAEERSGRNGVIFTLEENWASFQDAMDTVDVQKKFLDAAREREAIAEAEYSTGLISFNDWIIIEDNLVKAEKSFLDSRANALTAETNWRQAKGETLDDE